MSVPELLVAIGLLAFVLVLPPVFALMRQGGRKVAYGNRTDVPSLPEWAERAKRAQRNMVDTLVPFAVIMIGVQAAGVPLTDVHFGVELFFGSRIAHAIIYIIGIPYLRTLAFVVGVIGMLVIAQTVLPIPAISGLFG